MSRYKSCQCAVTPHHRKGALRFPRCTPVAADDRGLSRAAVSSLRVLRRKKAMSARFNEAIFRRRLKNYHHKEEAKLHERDRVAEHHQPSAAAFAYAASALLNYTRRRIEKKSNGNRRHL
ncbi:hypothetical protein EVAR_49108_1 [Eumeta japonica]|uniref:Uncharacterized protein n=1 Tax=Eumeta variegata TaxID=151549 RepID=A0A4C1YNY0_EUMVA|nr:hypothetical protein EVAR_49108_1 [Eumeta japonica]